MSAPETLAAGRLAERMSMLETDSAFELLARVMEARGRKIIHLEIGKPGFDTPANVVEAAPEALRSRLTQAMAAILPDLEA